jgi:tetratricopeptide (TPR) repeat protein
MALDVGAQHHLTVAEGYIELGMPLDANEELDQIDVEQRILPAVVALRVPIYRALKKWDLMQVVAKMMALHEPDNPEWTVSWAYATRRTDSIEAARIILLTAVEAQPDVAIFHYNLAYYECLLGDVEVAKARLHHAFKLDPPLRLKALEDEDLKAVWEVS